MTHKTARKTVLSTSLLPWIAAVCLASPALAQTAAPSPTPAASGTATASGTNGSTLLDEVVVTATRTDETAVHITSPYTKIDGEELQTAQINNVAQAVALSPGVDVTVAGTRGGTTAVNIWGTRAQDTLVLVDGIKTSSSLFQGGSPFLSVASSLNLDSVEILRGAHSVLYGSDAVGGVLSLQTLRGSGTPTTTVFFEGGSHDSFREGLYSSGSLGQLDYSFHYAHDDTQNERDNNDLHVNSASMRLDYTINDRLTVGATVRTQEGKYHEPGAIYLSDPNAEVDTETTVVSTYAELKATDFWTTKLTLGTYQERYVYFDPLNPGDSSSSLSRSTYESALWSADWQNTFQLTESNKLIAGTTLTYETGHEESFYDLPSWDYQTRDVYYASETREAVYLQDQWELVKNLTLNVGGRYDHYELSGDAWTYRGGLAYFFEPTHTKLRASYGTAFTEPGFYQTLITRAAGMPNLDPQRSRSWDAGVDQYLFHDYLTLGATFFHTNTRDLIDSVWPGYGNGYYINRSSMVSQGVELSAKAKLSDGWRAMIGYTYTDSEAAAKYWTDADQTTISGMQRYQRVPRHTITLDTNYTFALPKGKLTLGGGVQVYADRVDVDYNQYSYNSSAYRLVRMSDYTLLRVYARYQFNDHLAFTGRVENLTNQDYQAASGYPALGRTYYGGLQVTF
ncbi:MAG: TonB-dependent receptor [Chthoniobacteraceae bacterium]